MAALKKARAFGIFTVRYRAVRIKVRVLTTLAEVHRDFRLIAKPLQGEFVSGFFLPSVSKANRHIGTIVLPADGDLLTIVPHEVVHAVMQHIKFADVDTDEPLATLTGKISGEILRRLQVMGIEL